MDRAKLVLERVGTKRADRHAELAFHACQGRQPRFAPRDPPEESVSGSFDGRWRVSTKRDDQVGVSAMQTHVNSSGAQNAMPFTVTTPQTVNVRLLIWGITPHTFIFRDDGELTTDDLVFDATTATNFDVALDAGDNVLVVGQWWFANINDRDRAYSARYTATIGPGAAPWRPSDAFDRGLAGLQAPLGVYAVLGNHDQYTGAEEIADALALAAPHIRLLRRDIVRVSGEGPLYVAGVDDPGRNWSSAELHLPSLDHLTKRDIDRLYYTVEASADFPNACRIANDCAVNGNRFSECRGAGDGHLGPEVPER